MAGTCTLGTFLFPRHNVCWYRRGHTWPPGVRWRYPGAFWHRSQLWTWHPVRHGDRPPRETTTKFSQVFVYKYKVANLEVSTQFWLFAHPGDLLDHESLVHFQEDLLEFDINREPAHDQDGHRKQQERQGDVGPQHLFRGAQVGQGCMTKRCLVSLKNNNKMNVCTFLMTTKHFSYVINLYDIYLQGPQKV